MMVSARCKVVVSLCDDEGVVDVLLLFLVHSCCFPGSVDLC